MKRNVILGIGALVFLTGAGNAQVTIAAPEKGARTVVLQPDAAEAPPLTVTMHPQPPAPIVLSQRSRDDDNAQQIALAEFDVELTLNGQRMWAGPLRVGGRMGANMDQNIRQPYESCAGKPDMTSRMDGDAQRISIRINRLNERQEPDSFRVTASVDRPLPACEGGGSLSLGFTRSPTVSPGQSVVLDGDGKLKVRLTRKR